MELKELLAQNLRALMKQRLDLSTQVKLHKRTGLSQSTIQRVLAKEVHTGLDVLDTLAKAFGVAPTALISQGMTVPSILDDSQNQAPSTHSENALTLADLYDGLPKDRSLRLQKYRAATDALLRPQRPPGDQPNAKPAASVKARTQRA
jgi:transcriptional regulator with XRE-family HTH domain